MLVKIEDNNEIEKTLIYSIESDRVNATIDSFVAEIAPRVEARGFRKGHAPPTVIRTQFKDIILAECSARLVHEDVVESIKEKNIRVVGSPILVAEHRATTARRHVGNFNLDGSFSFAVTADVEPQISVKIPKLTVTEKLPSLEDVVMADLHKIRVSMAQLDFVERSAEHSDQVSIEFLDGSSGHASVAISDPPDVLADNEALVGKSAGDELEVVLADGSVVRAKVLAVFTRTLPELNDDLAKSALFESLDDMRKDIESKAANTHFAPLRAKIYYEILNQMIEANPIVLPSRWVDTEAKLICARIGLKEKSAHDENLMVQITVQADKNLRSNLILDGVYRDHENIHLSADEAFGIVESEAKKLGKETDEVLTHIRNTGQYETLMSFHERNRAIDYLISIAETTQEKV